MSSTPVRPWLGSFIRESLSSYLSQDEPNEHIENDGTCLNFKSIRQEPWCSIIHWKQQGPNSASAALMDPDWQINATITDDPQILKNANPRRHIARLLDFKLILHYAQQSPEVYLRVDRIQIDWERGVQKFNSAKSFRKNHEFKSLVEQVCQRVNSHKSAPGHFGLTSLVNGPSPASQLELHEDTQKGSFSQISSQQFLSQVSPAQIGTKERHIGSVSGPSRNDLLRHLKSHNALQPSGIPVGSHVEQVDSQFNSGPVPVNHANKYIEPSREQTISAENPPAGKDRRRESSVASRPDIAAKSSSFWTHVLGPTTFPTSQELTATQAAGAIPETHKTTLEAVTGSPPVATRKRQRDDEHSSLINSDILDACALSPSKKLKHNGDHVGSLSIPMSVPLAETIKTTMANFAQPQSINVEENIICKNSELRPDPWEGLTRIADIDITIPKDQKILFEDTNEAWIPPKPGQPQPRAHVPPSLLKVWNDIAIRKQRDADRRDAEKREAERKNLVVEPPISQTQETRESDDSDREYSWSPSPERDATKPSGIPPSSPVREDVFVETRISKPNRKLGTSQLSSTNAKNLHANAFIAGFQQEKETAKSQDDANHPRTDDIQSKKGLNADATMTEAPAPSLSIDGEIEENEQYASPGRSGESKAEHENVNSPTSSKPSSSKYLLPEDDSDNESMMDASVPVALGEVIPDPTQSSQNGQELMSSGPSLPDPNEYVQVSETPAVGAGHLQYRQGFSRRDDPDSSNQNLSPSKVHKSSSQSRVMNTFPPQGSHEEGQSSRETANLSTQSEEAESIRVDVPGTQSQISMNSTSQSQNASTNSQHDIVLESSGRPERHQKLPHPSTDITGQPASSLNVPVSHEKSQSQSIEASQRSPISQSESKVMTGNTPCPPPRQSIANPKHRTSAEGSPMKGFFTGRLERPVSSEPKTVTAAIEVVIPRRDEQHSPRAISEPVQEKAPAKAPASLEIEFTTNTFQSTDGSHERPPSPTVEMTVTQSSHVKSRRATTQSIEPPAKVEEIDETDMEDIDDMDDTRHETASVELGDDSYVSHASPQVAESTASDIEVDDAESESENENWFVSLRHLRRPREGWSDSTKTPFKSWAEAELNSFSERRRRGWTRVQLDEKGIIRRLASG